MTNNKIKELILDGATYDNLLNDYKIPKYEILQVYYLLLNKENIPSDMEYNIRQEYLKHISFLNIEDDKVLFVSDQHIGSKGENLFYQEFFYHLLK